MKKTLLFLFCILFSCQSSSFTAEEEAAAYKKLSVCSDASVDTRMKHLSYSRAFATEEKVSLEQVVEHYNRLNCVTYDSAMLKIAESIAVSSTNHSRVDLLIMASRLHVGLKGFSYFPTGILADTLDAVLKVVEESGGIDGPVETYLNIFSTVDWHKWSSSNYDNQSDYEDSSSPQQAKEALSVYLDIWNIQR